LVLLFQEAPATAAAWDGEANEDVGSRAAA
jgi:hypothetical protein